MIAPYVVCRSATGHSEAIFRETAPLTDLARREEFRDRFQRLAFSSEEVRLLAQLFARGEDEELGPLARDGFARVCHLLHNELEIPLAETRRIFTTGWAGRGPAGRGRP